MRYSDLEARVRFLERRGRVEDAALAAAATQIGALDQAIVHQMLRAKAPSDPMFDLTCCEAVPLDGSILVGRYMTLDDGTDTLTLDRFPELSIGMSVTPAPFGGWGLVVELPLASTTPTKDAGGVAGFGGTTAVRFEFYDPDAAYQDGEDRPAPPRVCHLRLYLPTNPSGVVVRGVSIEDFFDAYNYLVSNGTGGADPPAQAVATPTCSPFSIDFSIHTGTIPQVNSFCCVYGKSKNLTIHIEGAT